jgi:DNA-binding transcriptional regulator YiaG
MHDDRIGVWRRSRDSGSDSESAAVGDRGVVKKQKKYHYTESGLKNVWLRNGFHYVPTPYGTGVSINNVEGLHKAIALALLKKTPHWSGAEFRFIRKELDMSQVALASFLGKDVQSIARWEKRGRVPKMADRFMRMLYREHIDGNEKIIEIINRLNDMDKQQHQKMLFSGQNGKWKQAA